jgi:cytoskeletal protein RodZ
MVSSEAKPRPKAPRPPKAQPKPKPGPGAAKPKQLGPDPGDDMDSAPDSGTPDLRSLTTSLKPAAPKRDKSERVDESLFTFGAGPIADMAMAPPTIDLTTAPVEDEPEADRQSEPPNKSGAGTTRSTPARTAEDSESKSSPVLWLLLGAAAIVAVVWWVGSKPSDAAGSAASTAAATTTETASQPTSATEPTTTAAQPEPETTTSAEPTPETTARSPETPTAAGTTGTTTGEPKQPKEPSEALTSKDPAEPKEPAETKEPKEPAEEPVKEVPLAGPFDPGAARSALNAAAGSASGCRQEGDPSGTASVVVTFATSGRVTSATVNGPPFAGTRTGGCIASRMRSARVPPFSGSPITVSKTVTIQ